MIIDVAFFVAIVYGIYKGITAGFFKSTLHYAKVIISLIASLNFSYVIHHQVAEKSGLSANYIPILSFIAMFILVMFLLKLLGNLTEKMSKDMGVDFAYRGAGSLVWLIVLSVIFSSLIGVAEKSDVITASVTANSSVYPILEPVHHIAYNVIDNLVPALQNLIDSVINLLSDLLGTVQEGVQNKAESLKKA